MTQIPPGVHAGMRVEFLKACNTRNEDEARCTGRVLAVCSTHLVVDIGLAWGDAQIVPPARLLHVG